MAERNIRQITARELCDLSENWENSKVDTNKYYQSVLAAWEVDEDTYRKLKAAGNLCQESEGRFYIGESGCVLDLLSA